jgi:hypothetical protein
MRMPETSVHEDYNAVPRQDDVGAAREVLTVQSESVPQPVQNAANDPFRSGIVAPNPGHNGTPLFDRETIHNAAQPIEPTEDSNISDWCSYGLESTHLKAKSKTCLDGQESHGYRNRL